MGLRLPKGLQLLIFFILTYLTLWEFWHSYWLNGFFKTIFTLGALLNLIVVWANKGKMPVLTENERQIAIVSRSPKHCLLTEESRFPWLADRFKIGKKICSLGDILLTIGFIGIAIIMVTN